MLTSKEIIERTRISRATLNNYIAAGLIARPDVLPPAPDDGAAPRIGYFPDDTIDRIRSIQRLKGQGWTMGRIAEHFARGGTEAPVESRAVQPSAAPAVPPPLEGVRLQLADAGSPAYLVDDRFALAWQNPACATSPLSPVAGMRIGAPVLEHLAASNAPGAHAILRFHLAVAKDRGVDIARFGPDEVRATGAIPVAHMSLPASGGLPLRLGFAVHFSEHVLFAFSAAGIAGTAAPRAAVQGPSLASVAVVVATLQDANGLWARMSPHEYFELANEAWVELEAVFRRHRGVLGRHSGEGVVCYCLRESGDAHLANALAAARAAKDAMRALNRRWQERKNWDLDIAMNIGIDEGQEWMGPIGADEFRVLGEAAERAEQLSRCGRGGSILVTRAFIGKLPPAERARRTPRTFAPLSSVCPGVPARLAEVAVAEILDPPASAA